MITLRFDSDRSSSGNPVDGWMQAGRLYVNGEIHRVVEVRADFFAWNELSRSDVPKAEELTWRWALDQLRLRAEAGEFDGEYSTDVVVVDVAAEDVVMIVARGDQYPCRYRDESMADWRCTVADEAGTRVTLSICRECEVPAEEWRCRHLKHPAINAIRTGGGTTRLFSGLCDIGQNSDLPGGCRLGGNDCCDVSIAVTTSAAEPDAVPALRILELLDHFEALWRLHFGRTHRLFGPGSLADVAALGQPVHSLDDLRSRLGSLNGLLDRIVVADDLMPPTGEAEAWKISRPLVRMAAVANEWSDDAASAAERIRAIHALNNKLKHAPQEQAIAFAKAGISYPPESWQQAWDELRMVIVGSLRQLVGELQRVTDGESSSE